MEEERERGRKNSNGKKKTKKKKLINNGEKVESRCRSTDALTSMLPKQNKRKKEKKQHLNLKLN